MRENVDGEKREDKLQQVHLGDLLVLVVVLDVVVDHRVLSNSGCLVQHLVDQIEL